MTHESDQEIINQLDKLLEVERNALLEGNLEKIASMVEEKETLIDTLNAFKSGPERELAALQEKVMRNQALLDGALQGIRTVAARMATFRKIRRSLETYDERGRKQIIQGEVERKVEKRA